MMGKIRNYAHNIIGIAWAMSTANFSNKPPKPLQKKRKKCRYSKEK